MIDVRRRTRAHAPMDHYDVRVRRVRRLSPRMVRITFGGAELAAFADDGHDQRIKLFLPGPGQDAPDVPRGPDWFGRWRARPEHARPVMRTYTIRTWRPADQEIDVDFVLHGDGGPASAWAARARSGDRATIFGAYAEYDPPDGTDWQLIAGDETALPAIGAILDALPAGTAARVFVEVADEGERRPLPSAADVDVTWLPRSGAPAGHTAVLQSALRGARFPDGRPYAWVAGESGMVTTIRRHLVREREVPADAVMFRGYWRRDGAMDP